VADPDDADPDDADPSALTRIGLGATPEGDNSAYLLADRGVVVDPGPPTADAWARLRGAIGRETSLDAIDHVLVTHWHIDHVGLAPRLAEAADATIYLHERDAPLVADYATERPHRVERDRDRLLAWGVPEATVDRLVDGDSPSPVPDSVPVEALSDGDRVAGVECLHTPGHTAGHAAFLVGERGGRGRDTSPAPLVGDLVLPGTTPNVGGGDTRMANPLPTYLASLDRLANRVGDPNTTEAEVDAYPGHGTAFALQPRLVELRRHHAARLDDCVAVVADAVAAGDAESVTPYAVATTLFGEMHGIHVKMGAGEAASHLAAAADEGRVERVDDDPVRYRPR
jgi:glyoxylase-like metal-dependent hydrolase (beta-lactamase superfamily II)